jgi:hypothetical protein
MSAQVTPRAAGPSGPRSDGRSGAPQGADRASATGTPRPHPKPPAVPEIGGPQGPEPTRYGDWEKGGRCTDF